MCPPCCVEVIEVDVTGSILIEEAENDFVFGVRFCEQILEDRPVVYADFALLVTIGYFEKDAVLVSFDFVLGTNTVLTLSHQLDQSTYKVLALGRDSVDELILGEEILA